MVTDDSYTCDDHSIRYGEVESLSCTLEINGMLCFDYIKNCFNDYNHSKGNEKYAYWNNVQDWFRGECKMMMEVIKESFSKWRNILGSGVGSFNVTKMSILYKLI